MIEYIARIMNLTEEEVINNRTFLVNAFDQEHRVLFWNKRCEKYFGIREEEALGNILEDLVPYVSDNRKMRLLETALSGKAVFVADDKYDKINAHYTQIILPLKNDDGTVVAAVNIVSDVPQPRSGFPGSGRISSL